MTIAILALVGYVPAFADEPIQQSSAATEEEAATADYDAEEAEFERMLQEIEVTPESIRHEGDHDFIVLGENNKNFGSTAVDAISSLPQFRSTLASTSLSTIGGEQVTILINGVKVAETQLLSIKSQQIGSLKYYPVAPPQYQMWSTGPVIDVKLTRIYKWELDGNLFTKNSLTRCDGMNNVSASWSDSLNYLMCSYNIMYTVDDSYKTRDSYRYFDKSPQVYNGNYGLHSLMNRVEAAYYHFWGNNMAYISNSFSPNSKRTHSFGEGPDADDPLVTATRRSESDGKSLNWIGTLYGHLRDNDKQALSLHIEPSYSKNDDTNALDITRPASRFNALTDVRSHTFGLGIQAYYQRVMAQRWGAYHSMAVKGAFGFRDMTQWFPVESTGLYYNQKRGDLSLSWIVNGQKWGGFASLNGMTLAYRRIDGSSNHFYSLTPRISLYYNASKTARLRFDSSLGRSFPTMGQLSPVVDYEDENYYRQQNPSRKPFTTWSTNIAADIFALSRKLYIAPRLSYSHKFDSYTNSLVWHDGSVVSTSVPTNVNDGFSALLSLKYSPWRWLSINPLVEYSIDRYNTFYNRIRHCHLEYFFNTTMNYKNNSLIFQYGNLGKSYSGDQLYVYSETLSLSYMWKYRNMTLSLVWSRNCPRIKSFESIPDFQHEYYRLNRSQRSNISIGFSYNFQYGRKDLYHNTATYLNSFNDDNGRAPETKK